ncbi:caspase family protein [Adonisia turfae]|uniref:Uncharacterized protein n=1 Tax=Adonisia turfae CCMR0081 TaxID=2292702 RepID=A0A6M0RRL5_9CYAN|nr:caspase family protein [Adonisia turfae]NEZ58904.1 hypothetical protein [Adonisia turfae CCMR0081]
MSRDALIVGINQYQTLPRLTAAAKDAEGIANLLENHGNFRVRRLPEIIQNQRPKVGQQTLVSTQQLENSLVRLLLPKGNHIPEAVFFYFSGHGLQREIGIREGYLATSETQPNNSNNSGISLSWLRRLIKHSPIRQIIIILDCCHSGEFLSLKDEAWQGCDGQSYLFIAASREYEEAYESLSSDYSVLTQAVISSLRPQNSNSGRVTSTDLVASITNQLSGELQQPLFEQGGSEIVITQHTELSTSTSENISIISRLKQYSFNFCPYRGPHPFEEKHAEYYFGRDELIQELLQSLQQTNVCAVVGASGSGKTSLLRAGLIPRLSAGNDILGSENWLIRYVNLGTTPLKTLATAFTLGSREIDVAKQLWQAEELLRHESSGLINLATAALLKQPTGTKLWLVIDQFEELLMPTTDPLVQQERAQVMEVLVTALRCSSIALGVVIGIRSDALDHLTCHSEMFSLIENNQVVIKPMNYQAIRSVIEKPAEKLGLKIDPHLVHHLTLDLTGAPGELALLQSILYELWQHRTPMSYSKGGPCLSVDSYMKLGRLSQMLTNRATTFYESLPANEQAIAKRIFIALCDLGDGRLDQGRSVRKSELINPQFSAVMVERMLQKLVAARLVVSDKPHLAAQTNGQTIATAAWQANHHSNRSDMSIIAHWCEQGITSDERIELAHKSLVSDWHLLRQWLQADRPALRQQRDLETRAWIWHSRGELKCSDYLLGQKYLNDISQFLLVHGQELSTLAQKFIQLSKRTAIYQQWRNRSVAVLLPLAVMAGMTASLVRHQLTMTWQSRTAPGIMTPLSTQQWSRAGNTISPQLPQRWGIKGTDQLAMTSQILDFRRRHPNSELNQLSIIQLTTLMTPGVIMANSATLPDENSVLGNDEAGIEP